MQLDFHQLTLFPLFTGICEEDLPAMLTCLGSFQKRYKKEEIILLESNEVRSVGIILSGTVHMIKNDSEGYQTLLVTMKEGELFGESFSCGSHLDARVSFLAATSCIILFLPFYKVIHSCKLTCTFHHRLIENMVRLIGDKNVQLMDKIEVISKKNTSRKDYGISAPAVNGTKQQTFYNPIRTIRISRISLCRSECSNKGAVLYAKSRFDLL